MTEKNGELPKGWKWVKLSDVVDVRDGTHDSPRYIQSGIPLITSKNLKDGEIDFDNVQFISYEDYEKIRQRSGVNKGDIIYAMIGTVGNPVVIRTDREFAIKNVALFKFNDSPVFNEYFYYLVQSPPLTQQIEASTQGGIQKFVSLTVLRNLEIPLPPLPEQKRIVAILNEQMAAVEKARAAAEAQLQAAKTLPAAYLREVFDSPESQKWERKKLGEVCKIVAPLVDPKVPEYGILPHVNGENIESGTCRITYLNTAFEEGMTSGKYLFDSGDILYTKLRPYLRKVAVVDFQGLCSADTYPIKVDSKYLDNQFTGWLLVSDTFTNYANEASARARMPKLNREQLFAWETPIPPIHLQKAMAEKLNRKIDEVKSLCEMLQDQLDTIKQLPAALLRQAFNGEL